MIWLDLQVDVSQRSAIACQVEIRSNQRRSQKSGDDAAFAIESFADLGSDAIGLRASFRELFRQGPNQVAVALQSYDLVLDDLGV
ncbi:hypothetical protein [Sphingomonas colocasiae]|uniref:Uncharacterized protein n=1 Tax=Sphingomonas colocasiae TaxID=1848973 RepID=A0ABS7PPC8_9SPHN|nr:hypothetical protein [Sphingomonas colocasiae]MBY8823175.1 hypothetical protein [Sphingomonas colocasiae]